MSVMNTFSGKKFDPMHMNSEDVSLEDLAQIDNHFMHGILIVHDFT